MNIDRVTCLNGIWRFCVSDTPAQPHAQWYENEIQVLSPFNINSFAAGYIKSTCGEEYEVSGADLRLYPGYPEEWDTAVRGFYKRQFLIPADPGGRRFFLRFDAVAFRWVVSDLQLMYCF